MQALVYRRRYWYSKRQREETHTAQVLYVWRFPGVAVQSRSLALDREDPRQRQS